MLNEVEVTFADAGTSLARRQANGKSKPNLDRDLAVAYRRVESLTPYKGNARTHSGHQIRKIAESIRTFGFTNPILIDAQDTIVAGHGRVEAAKLLGIEEVPTIRLDSLKKEQVRAYVIADNRLAEDAGWDEQILKIELQNIILDGSVDICQTGFEVAEIDLILGAVLAADSADDLPDAADGLPVSQIGDVWILGKHRVVCGDALQQETFALLMGGRHAAVTFTDPPYNVVIGGHASGNGMTRHREFAMASGEMSSQEFTEFLSTALERLSTHSSNGSVHFVCMDWRHIAELMAAGTKAYGTLLNLCVWTKDNGGMGSFYRSQHELVFVFRNGKASHRNNIQLGRYGRYRTNVWNYPGANTLSRSGEEGNLVVMHPTVKPVAMIADALLDCSARGDIVLDSFLGSGSTLLAAERTSRRCYGIEIDPRYVDLAARRWEKYTGESAVLESTGASFAEVQLERSPGGGE